MGFLNHQQYQPSFLGPEIHQFLACLVVHLFAGQGGNNSDRPRRVHDISENFSNTTPKHPSPILAEGSCLLDPEPSQAPTVGYWPTVAMTGNGELGFDSEEGAGETATTSNYIYVIKEGSRRANYPILTQGGSDKKYQCRAMKMIFLVQHIFLFESDCSDMLFACYFHFFKMFSAKCVCPLRPLWHPKRYIYSQPRKSGCL